MLDHLELEYKKSLYTTLYKLKRDKKLTKYTKYVYDYVIENFVFKEGQVLKICDIRK